MSPASCKLIVPCFIILFAAKHQWICKQIMSSYFPVSCRNVPHKCWTASERWHIMPSVYNVQCCAMLCATHLDISLTERIRIVIQVIVHEMIQNVNWDCLYVAMLLLDQVKRTPNFCYSGLKLLVQRLFVKSENYHTTVQQAAHWILQFSFDKLTKI